MGKKVVIMGVSSIILVAMVVAVAVGVTRDGTAQKSDAEEIPVSSKAVQSICQPTDYKEACEKSLSSANTTEPKELVKIAFKAAKEQISLALQNSTELEKLQKDPKTSQALQTCNEALDLAIDNLQESFDKLGSMEWSKIGDYVNDLQTWLSGSYSYGTMCLDAFEDNSTSTVEAKKKMEKAIQSAKELTSNALVMVNQIEKVLSSLSFTGTSRRLLSDDGFPTWLSEGKRQLLSVPASRIKPNAVVAKDGSGQFKTLTDALAQVPIRKDNRTYVIHVKAGVYQEYVEIGKKMTHIMIIGDGPTKTKFTGSKNYVDGVNTFKTGTFRALGAGFIAKGVGFENSAGSEKHQAVALHVAGDMSVIHNCQIDGYQDTLLTAANRQFYKDCTISGTVDFIFGYGSAVFQNCKMLVRKPSDNQQCMVTADGRDNAHLKSGIVIQNSVITASPEMAPVKKDFDSYLGRPWKPLARTIIMNTLIDDVIHPDGWMPWAGDMHIDTCFYGEFNNKGVGANLSKRVTWSKKISAKEAGEYTVARFIAGDKWIPKSGVPFVAGL
uniref:Pectinesterase n=1 Tax=Kalanchoe fedtschenkoi TaxID=63787 RepID=A0A7N0UK16_KALFE